MNQYPTTQTERNRTDTHQSIETWKELVAAADRQVLDTIVRYGIGPELGNAFAFLEAAQMELKRAQTSQG